MIDNKGYRYNVGIIICNFYGQVLWAKRYKQNFWQFPQGGIRLGETPEEAMYRELFEEIGLYNNDVRLLSVTNGWLTYKIPSRWVRKEIIPLCIGQKQKWFLLQLLSNDATININVNSAPEFDSWCWVSFWYPIHEVIFFKRNIYRKVMKEFSSTVFYYCYNL